MSTLIKSESDVHIYLQPVIKDTSLRSDIFGISQPRSTLATTSQTIAFPTNTIIISDQSSCTDDGLLYIRAAQLFQIFTQSLDAIDVTSVTLSC